MREQRIRPFDQRTKLYSIHQYRYSNSPYTLSSSLSTKYTPSKCSSCQCSSSKSNSSTESRQSRHQLRIEEIRRKQRISYILIFLIIIICLLILVFIIENTSHLNDIINYFNNLFYSPKLLVNEATRKTPSSFTGKPIIWNPQFDKD